MGQLAQIAYHLRGLTEFGYLLSKWCVLESNVLISPKEFIDGWRQSYFIFLHLLEFDVECSRDDLREILEHVVESLMVLFFRSVVQSRFTYVEFQAHNVQNLEKPAHSERISGCFE